MLENIDNLNRYYFFKKIGQPQPLFCLFLFFSNKQYNFLQQINVKKCHVHQVFVPGTRTHNLSNLSCLP